MESVVLVWELEKNYLNSLCWQNGWSASIQVMACHLFGAKPLPESMLIYGQLDPLKQTSVKFYKIQVFIQENALNIITSAKWRTFYSDPNVLSN